MRLKAYLNKCKQQEIPLAYYDENLDCLEELKEAIHLQIRNGRVEDNASKLLKSLREDAAHCTLPEKWECLTRCF